MIFKHFVILCYTFVCHLLGQECSWKLVLNCIVIYASSFMQEISRNLLVPGLQAVLHDAMRCRVCNKSHFKLHFNMMLYIYYLEPLYMVTLAEVVQSSAQRIQQ